MLFRTPLFLISFSFVSGLRKRVAPLDQKSKKLLLVGDALRN
jgi:hypothetical protein